jgi:prepilin-type N-terminal cleavage/methylation domain-containing protein/prepilin-type processing-associated H-X9-DG protein
MQRPKRAAFTLLELLVVVAIIGILISLLLAGLMGVREGARRAGCANNLMQIGVALRNYQSAQAALPPGTIEPKGPVYSVPQGNHLGWMVQILPYLEQRSAYDRIDFSVGVYDKKNAAVRAMSFDLFVCPSYCSPIAFVGGDRSASLSCYAGCHNDVEAPIDENNNGVLFLDSRIRDEDITDGLRHTILIGEKLGSQWDLGWMSGTRATLRNTGTDIDRTPWDSRNPYDGGTADKPDWAEVIVPTPAGPVGMPSPSIPGMAPAAPGMNPENENPQTPGANAASAKPIVIPIGPNDLKVGGFGSSHPGVANFLLGDGSVLSIGKNIDSAIFQRLGSRNDGKILKSGPTRK